jgi:copper(I)-binding protein
MSTTRLLAVSLLTAVAVASSACARECTPRLEDGWLRLPPGSMPMLAGFARIENTCPVPIVLVAARSPAFADVSLHETRLEGGISRMRAVPELPIAAGEKAELKPGGLHLMLMDPRAPVKAGDTVTIELDLKDGRTLRGNFPVRAIGG